MKNLVIIFLVASFATYAQPGSVVRNDTAFIFDPATGIYTQVTKQDTSALPRFTDKVKGLITWANVQNKPPSYTAAAHTHPWSDIVSGKPTTLSGYGITDAFDGTWPSLIGKPTTTSFLSNSTDKNFVTDAKLIVLNNTSGTNTGDQDLSGYAPVTRTINTHALTGNVTVTASDVGLGNVDNTSDVNKPVSSATQTALNAKQATLVSATNIKTINGNTLLGSGDLSTSTVVAQINATAQAANIATATLYAVPSAGFYRVSIYITVTQAATTSSTMPSTTITYTDGNSGTNSHSTTTTATNASNSVTTSFAQTTYVLYAKASTNIQYSTGSYASSGATAMQYALRIRVEAL